MRALSGQRQHAARSRVEQRCAPWPCTVAYRTRRGALARVDVDVDVDVDCRLSTVDADC